MVWHKIFGLAQNILGPVEGQGIISLRFCCHYPLINYLADYQEIEREEEMVSEDETLNSGEDLKVTKESDKPKSMPISMKKEETEVQNGLNELDDRPTW